jgi:hypothetical protein
MPTAKSQAVHLQTEDYVIHHFCVFAGCGLEVAFRKLAQRGNRSTGSQGHWPG